MRPQFQHSEMMPGENDGVAVTYALLKIAIFIENFTARCLFFINL